MPFEIEPLSSRHNLEGFNCGEDSMNRYLRHFAWQNNKIGLSRTFVAVEAGETQVKGFYTLSNGNVSYNVIPGPKKGWPKYPIPITLLGQLAADVSIQGQRLGETLLMDALKRALQASEQVASYAVVVDALHEKARDFYTKYGFEHLDTDLRLYLPMGTIQELGFGQ